MRVLGDLTLVHSPPSDRNSIHDWKEDRSYRRRPEMLAKTVLAAMTVLSFAAPALADEYYVVRGPDQHCTITTTKPTETTTIAQIGPLAFKTRDEAQDR